VDEAEHHHKRILILRHGKPAAAIVPVDVAIPPEHRLSGAEIEKLFADLGGASPQASAVEADAKAVEADAKAVEADAKAVGPRSGGVTRPGFFVLNRRSRTSRAAPSVPRVTRLSPPT